MQEERCRLAPMD